MTFSKNQNLGKIPEKYKPEEKPILKNALLIRDEAKDLKSYQI
jgi:hypothetical protein